jgi:alpha-mannosidase
MTSMKDAGNTKAIQFGWCSQTPFVARILPQGKVNDAKKSLSALSFNASNVLLVNARPSYYDKSIVLQLRETEGKPTSFTISNEQSKIKIKSIDEINVIEETLKKGITDITLKPYEVKFLKVLTD